MLLACIGAVPEALSALDIPAYTVLSPSMLLPEFWSHSALNFKVSLSGYFDPIGNLTPPTSARSFDPIFVSRVENYVL